jgi:uncharacterized protein YjbI with pentapeptide repeats
MTDTWRREGYDTIVLDLSKNSFQQCTFTGSIWPDQRNQFATVDMERDIAENLIFSSCNIQRSNLQTARVTAVFI